MSFLDNRSTAPQQSQETPFPTHDSVVQKKLPFHQPQIGPFRHLSQVTGQGGSSSEYDSYDYHRK
jgi:hypothetical protein